MSRLPSYLRHPVQPAEARAILHQRFERRGRDFTALVRQTVYQNPASPYRELLGLAGCEYGDLERLVNLEGVEGALQALGRRGVYLTVDELKGRRPAVRGSASIALSPGRLRNPRSGWHLATRSSGSRGASVTVPIDLDSVRDRAVNLCLSFDLRGGSDWLYALWGVPGGAYTVRLLEYRGFGVRLVRWFSQIDPAAPGLDRRYRWSARALRAGSLLAGVPLPRPRHVPLDQPLAIARWMSDVLRAGRTPHLHTFPSSAVRLSRAALQAGFDLRGGRFTVTGEPVTAPRLDLIRKTGAQAEPRYGTNECSPIGYACLAPEAPDDLHVFHDLFALIQPESAWQCEALPDESLLITTLRPTAPMVMLNVSLGDVGRLRQRACGCPMERSGWATHLHTIRSHEKLTAAGMAFLDADVARVLETVLPARFGGGPTDFQLLEEQSADGQARLRLLADPCLGPLQASEVADAFLGALGAGSGAERLMALVWRDADVLRVERETPHRTSTGKILHVHAR